MTTETATFADAEAATTRIMLRVANLDLRHASLAPRDRARLDERCLELEQRLAAVEGDPRSAGTY